MFNISLLKKFAVLQVLLLVSTSAVASKREREDDREDGSGERRVVQLVGNTAAEAHVAVPTANLAGPVYSRELRADWEDLLNQLSLFYDTQHGEKPFVRIAGISDGLNVTHGESNAAYSEKFLITTSVEDFFRVEKEGRLMVLFTSLHRVEDSVRNTVSHPFSRISGVGTHMLEDWRRSGAPMALFCRWSGDKNLDTFLYNIFTYAGNFLNRSIYLDLYYSNTDYTDDYDSPLCFLDDLGIYNEENLGRFVIGINVDEVQPKEMMD